MAALVVVHTPPAVQADGPRIDPTRVRWSRFRPDMITSVRTTRPVVAMSFDDGPHPDYTSYVLDVLRRHDARATFFDEGASVLAHPELVRRTVAEGHEVANHTFTHPDLPPLHYAQVVDEVRRTARAFQEAGVAAAPLFRPPRGRFDREAADAVRSTGLTTVGWNVCVERFLATFPDDSEAVAAMLDRVRPGSIVLAHDGGVPDRSRTMAVLAGLVGGLRQRGYDVVTVGELLRDAR
ncbi:MAG: polysaccharide deacetylase family protein [Actinobacteria bacterium]|nr:polysaccharide deacetylase family protein [Actinomycetota bacterium]